MRLSAEHGYAMAQYSLGAIYHDDEIIDQDFQEAAKWYKLAAEQGIASAQINLGRLHKDGKGVSKDSKEAIKWFGCDASM